MPEDARIPEVNWKHGGVGRETSRNMSQPRPGIIRRALEWVYHHKKVVVVGGVTSATLLAAKGGDTSTAQPTLNPEQAAIHQMEKNGMPQSDEAMKLDKEFPASRIQTKEVSILATSDILTAPTKDADKVNKDDLIIDGTKLVAGKPIGLTNGLEITTDSGKFLVLMNVSLDGRSTTVYLNEGTAEHPFGDVSVPATHDVNGGYQSTDGAITADKINVITTPQISPLNATP